MKVSDEDNDFECTTISFIFLSSNQSPPS